MQNAKLKMENKYNVLIYSYMGTFTHFKKSATTPNATHSPLNRGTNSGGCAEVTSELISPFQRTHYNKKLLNRSKTMSRAMTKAESRIWFDLLSKKQLLGLKFIKQKIVFSYILDFYCSELALAIEIDGDSHDEKLDYDQARDDFIKAYGIKVIRLTNQDVLENLDGVRDRLIGEIKK
jgi:very-short-patch-repair endonuclease